MKNLKLILLFLSVMMVSCATERASQDIKYIEFVPMIKINNRFLEMRSYLMQREFKTAIIHILKSNAEPFKVDNNIIYVSSDMNYTASVEYTLKAKNAIK